MEPRRGFLTQPGTLFLDTFKNFLLYSILDRDNLLYQLARQTNSKMMQQF